MDADPGLREDDARSQREPDCHGDRGEGNREVGAPRLNDQVWLNGGSKAQIMSMVNNPRLGVMPAWQGRLDPAVVNMLTVFVHSLGGGE